MSNLLAKGCLGQAVYSKSKNFLRNGISRSLSHAMCAESKSNAG